MPHDNLVPTISIALCTYNGAHYLRQQLDSLLAQTFERFEIIAQDDASTDDTVGILLEYSRHDARLRVAVNESNLGFRRNFESALRKCSGAYIAPCDQDDVWMPDKLAALLSIIQGKALAYCDSELIDTNGRLLGMRISDKLNMLNTDDPTSFVFANCVSGHAMLIRRDVLDRALPIPEAFMHDWWLAAVATTLGGILFYDRCLVRYRQHPSTVTDFMSVRERPRSRDRRQARAAANRQTEERIAALAALDGGHQADLIRFRELWRARNEQWLSPELAAFAFRHRAALYAIRKQSKWSVAIKAARQFVGHKLKGMSTDVMPPPPGGGIVQRD